MNLPPTSSSRQELDYQQEYSDNELDTATNLNLESGLELTPNQQHLLTWLNNLTIHDTVSTNSPTEDNLVVNEQSWCELRSCSEKITLINSLVRVPELGNMLSQPLKRKLNMLSQCHLSDNKERLKALRTSISIGNRILCEFLVKHTDSHQVISNLWNSVRSRGCQFLGPAIQEEILQLALLALEDGEALTRKVLILFIMQRLVPHFPYQTSKTAIGHVIQILYRASCFNVIKREGDSSLMQLKEEFRNYESLRREHDSQIVSIALENGLRISPEQWSSLLYGDNTHKSHMQSIIDKLQSIKPSFNKLIQKLKVVLNKTPDPVQIIDSVRYFEQLAYFEMELVDGNICTLEEIKVAIDAVSFITIKLLTFHRYLYQKQHPESVY